MRRQTLVAQCAIERRVSGPVATPMAPSTTYRGDSDGDQPFYSLFGNPNRDALEEILRELDGGAEAVAFPSGSASTAAVVQSIAVGGHVVAPDDLFHGSARLLNAYADIGQLAVTFVDMTDLRAVEAAIRPDTRLMLVESPTNPMLRVLDIRAISTLAREASVMVVVDNTWCTPLLQRPLELGADLAIQSTTKFVGGHSDVVGGVVVARERSAAVNGLRTFQQFLGAAPSAFDCWLLLRSLETLHCRLTVQIASARRIATFLEGHPEVRHVHYPGLPSHPQHELALRQMDDFGSMLSFEIAGDGARARRLIDRVEIWTRATSLGSTVSLIEQRARSPIQLQGRGSGFSVPETLLRLSVGVEDPDDLIEDLEQAIEGSGDPR